MKKYFSHHYLIYYILFLGLLIRLLLLFNGQRFVDGDEGVVGIMARHITLGARPLARYGQHYGGGHIIEAYLTALLFVLAGSTNSGILLKLPVVVFSLLTIYITYLVVRRHTSEQLAILTAGLLTLAAPFLRSGFKVNGYIETIFFCLVSFYYFSRIIFEKENTSKNYFYCGIFWGIAFWSFGFAIIYLVVYLLYSLYYEKEKWFKKGLWLFSSGAILGNVILIIENLRNNQEQFRGILTGEKSSILAKDWLSHFFRSGEKLFSHDLPAFLSPDCIHKFVFSIPWLSWFYYLLFLFSLVFSLYFVSQKSNSRAGKLIIFNLIFILVYLVIYVSTPFAGVSPRYLLALFPFISLLIAQLFLTLIKAKHRVTRYAGVVLLLAYFASQTVFAGEMLQNKFVMDLDIKSYALDIEHLIDFLNSLGIKHVHTDFFLQWRLVFASEEQILASSHNLGPKNPKYPYYESAVEMSQNYAVVLPIKSKYARLFTDSLRSRQADYRFQIIDDLIVFYDIKGNYRP